MVAGGVVSSLVASLKAVWGESENWLLMSPMDNTTLLGGALGRRVTPSSSFTGGAGNVGGSKCESPSSTEPSWLLSSFAADCADPGVVAELSESVHSTAYWGAEGQCTEDNTVKVSV